MVKSGLNLSGRILIGLLAILSIACTKSKTERDYKTEHVFVIVVDGPRYSETWGDPTFQYIPHMKNDLAPEGAIFTNFRNNGSTFTNPGHAAILTGNYQALNNTGAEKPLYPNFLNYWLEKTKAPRNKAWIFASKDKIAVLSDSYDPNWEGKYIPSLDCGVYGLGTGYRSDSITVKHIFDSTNLHHPSMVFINLREPDYVGHSGNWEGYLNELKQSDQYYFMLWNYLQTNPYYKDKTTVFITNDHGRHLDEYGGFAHHGDGCEGCRHINLFAAGPDFKKNLIIDREYEQLDISATIAELFHLNMETSTGNVMWELFEEE
jgi:hypothetical protein